MDLNDEALDKELGKTVSSAIKSKLRKGGVRFLLGMEPDEFGGDLNILKTFKVTHHNQFRGKLP